MSRTPSKILDKAEAKQVELQKLIKAQEKIVAKEQKALDKLKAKIK